MSSELLTVDEVARECKVHPITVRRLIARGDMRSVRVGRRVRVRREDLEAYIGNEPPVATRRHKTGIIREDDAIYRLVGLINDPRAADLSKNKHKYISDASYEANLG